MSQLTIENSSGHGALHDMAFLLNTHPGIYTIAMCFSVRFTHPNPLLFFLSN